MAKLTSRNPMEEKCHWVEGVDLTSGDVDDLFTVAGGPVRVLFIGLEITTAVSNNACLINFESDPTNGAANTDISAAGGAPDLALGALGDWFYVDGVSTDVAIKAANGTALPKCNSNFGTIIPEGGIDMKLSTANPTTGAATAYIRYQPLTSDARVV